MTTFNKILIENIENDSISKEDYYKIINLLSEIKIINIKYKHLEKEKSYLIKELQYIKTKQSNQIYNKFEKELNSSINRIYNIEEIELFQKTLNLKKEIISIIKKYPSNTLSKSSVLKYKNELNRLINKKETIKNEINYNKNELNFCKNHMHKKQTLEQYINKLTRFYLPKTEKEILKQQFYIDIFSKNKGR
ncbi:MAG: hypothetical protein J6J27_01795 [Alphaproteobacteria bacterium]|nr:hypothetical protein [Alphaproteobacteria bacterium]